MLTLNQRKSEYDIDPIFLRRWSPRAFADVEITETELFTMLEAARWAASSYNSQPWRFVYARRNTAHWERLLSLLVPFNQRWAKSASALIFLVSNSTMVSPRSGKEVPSSTHSLDAGAASAYFALQAAMMDWHVHGMAGFDQEKAFAELGVPKGHKVEAAYAVGKLGDLSTLPEELRSREKPSDRNALNKMVFEGRFAG